MPVQTISELLEEVAGLRDAVVDLVKRVEALEAKKCGCAGHAHAVQDMPRELPLDRCEKQLFEGDAFARPTFVPDPEDFDDEEPEPNLPVYPLTGWAPRGHWWEKDGARVWQEFIIENDQNVQRWFAARPDEPNDRLGPFVDVTDAIDATNPQEGGAMTERNTGWADALKRHTEAQCIRNLGRALVAAVEASKTDDQ